MLQRMEPPRLRIRDISVREHLEELWLSRACRNRCRCPQARANLINNQDVNERKPGTAASGGLVLNPCPLVKFRLQREFIVKFFGLAGMAAHLQK